jgi:hypothetical protein
MSEIPVIVSVANHVGGKRYWFILSSEHPLPHKGDLFYLTHNDKKEGMQHLGTIEVSSIARYLQTYDGRVTKIEIKTYMTVGDVENVKDLYGWKKDPPV